MPTKVYRLTYHPRFYSPPRGYERYGQNWWMYHPSFIHLVPRLDTRTQSLIRNQGLFRPNDRFYKPLPSRKRPITGESLTNRTSTTTTEAPASREESGWFSWLG